jgi:hypothetical protein
MKYLTKNKKRFGTCYAFPTQNQKKTTVDYFGLSVCDGFPTKKNETILDL